MWIYYGQGIVMLCVLYYIDFDNSVSGEKLGHLYFQKYNGDTFDETYNLSLMDCVTDCIRQAPRCDGINYSRMRLHCELSKTSIGGSNELTTDRYYLYSPRRSWDQGLLDSYDLPACDQGWQYYEDSCFMFDLQWWGNWTEAKKSCESHTARLVEIRSREKQDFLYEMVFTLANSTDTDVTIWTGGNDIAQEGVYLWNLDGSTFEDSNFTNWEQVPYAQPDDWHFNQGLSEDCVVAHYVYPDQSAWNDYLCKTNAHLMCEKKLS